MRSSSKVSHGFIFFERFPRDLSAKEKERAVDLTAASKFSEEICNEIVTVGSAVEGPEIVLQSCDRRTVPFLGKNKQYSGPILF